MGFQVLYRFFTTGNRRHIIPKTREHPGSHLSLFGHIIHHQNQLSLPLYRSRGIFFRSSAVVSRVAGK